MTFILILKLLLFSPIPVNPEITPLSGVEIANENAGVHYTYITFHNEGTPIVSFGYFYLDSQKCTFTAIVSPLF